jgi:hypothetical protein
MCFGIFGTFAESSSGINWNLGERLKKVFSFECVSNEETLGKHIPDSGLIVAAKV